MLWIGLEPFFLSLNPFSRVISPSCELLSSRVEGIKSHQYIPPMDYLVGTSPKESPQGSAHSKIKEHVNPTKGGAASLAAAPLAPMAPAQSSHSTPAPTPGATDMLDTFIY